MATFRLSRPTDAWPVPNLVGPGGAFIYVVSAFLAFLGVRLFLKGGARWAPLILGIGLAIAVAAFLVWATSGKSFSLTGMLQASLVSAVPIALGGLAGVLSERVAVVNIGIEGMLLAGAFTGALVGSLAGGLAGLAAAVVVGGVFGFALAALVVTYRMDQIIAGVFINLFVLGVTSYVSSQVFQEYRALNNAPVFRAIEIPILSDPAGDRPGVLQPEHFRLWRVHPCGACDVLSVSHPPRSAGGGRWGSIRVLRIHWGSTSTGRAISTSPSRVWSPGSAGRGSLWALSVALMKE